MTLPPLGSEARPPQAGFLWHCPFRFSWGESETGLLCCEWGPSLLCVSSVVPSCVWVLRVRVVLRLVCVGGKCSASRAPTSAVFSSFPLYQCVKVSPGRCSTDISTKEAASSCLVGRKELGSTLLISPGLVKSLEYIFCRICLVERFQPFY